ncbi:sirohydrochlorin chelatase [Cytobacillus sp. Hz8]|uniref:sirohydrochlorin chelatase n=1 Tax=Cytobacillus sp. Hz8 TaxID=3347168 RepID=UPI0035E12804
MKQAVLYVCHGSRLERARREAISFIERCQQRIIADIQQICFLELAAPSIEEGFRSCINKGATNIAVVPLLLFSAGHAKVDIPLVIQKMKDQFPFVNITYGRPVGVNENMVTCVADRLKETLTMNKHASVILIGRGSTDQQAILDFQLMAQLVKEKIKIEDVRICFLHRAKPSFDETLLQVQNEGRSAIFIPYLLFTGLLMKEIHRKINNAHKQNPYLQLGQYLGYDTKVEEAFIERVEEAIKKVV